jgi:Nucleoside phosphorylase
MEGAAIGAVAEIEEIPIIIVKGVQDYADYDKSDQFRQYAAEVSARFLLAFFDYNRISNISEKRLRELIETTLTF